MQNPGADAQGASRTPAQDNQGRPSERGDVNGGHTTSKLRGSCHACAMSKVKCPKEKPICSRCKSRGITCQYFFTKRPGRRRESSTSRGTDKDNRNNDAAKRVSNGNENTRPRNHSKTTHHFKSSSISNSDAENDGTKSSSDREKQDTNQDTIQVVPRPLRDAPMSVAATSPTSGSVAGGNANLESPPMSISTSPRPENMPTINSADLFSTLEDSDMFSGLMYPEGNVDDMEFVMSDIDACFWLPSLDGTVGPAQTQKDTASLLMQMPLESNNLGLIPTESPSVNDDLRLSGSSTSPSLASNLHIPLLNTDKTAATDAFAGPTRCGCLEQALYLLRMLSIAPSSSSSSSLSPSRAVFAPSPEPISASDSTSASDGVAAQAVLAENQQSIDAANSMLACSSCADDTFLLIVVSMIVLKTLERYATAARPSQPQQGAPKAGEGEAADIAAAAKLANSIIYSSKEQIRVLSRTYSAQRDERSRGRMAAQLVLGELHRVQRLVNQLSPKLKRSKEGVSGRNRGHDFDILGVTGSSVTSGSNSRYASGDVSKLGLTCFSASTLDQIENDVRQSLSALSAEIIKRLRQG